MPGGHAYCQSLVRERDYDRFIANLFATAAARPHLFALHAFESELTNAADAVREPMAGEIRLQWWRDALSGERAGEAVANPVAAAMLDTIKRFDLPHDLLLGMIDAHEFDLGGVPMEDMQSLMRHIDATAVASLGLGVLISGGGIASFADAAFAAGRALGLARVLQHFPHDIAKGRLFLPLDLLAEQGVHTDNVLKGENSEGLRTALRSLHENAHAEYSKLAEFEIPEPMRAVFLYAALVPLRLKPMTRPDYDPFHTLLQPSRLRRQFAIWRAARRHSFW